MNVRLFLRSLFGKEKNVSSGIFQLSLGVAIFLSFVVAPVAGDFIARKRLELHGVKIIDPKPEQKSFNQKHFEHITKLRKILEEDEKNSKTNENEENN